MSLELLVDLRESPRAGAEVESSCSSEAATVSPSCLLFFDGRVSVLSVESPSVALDCEVDDAGFASVESRCLFLVEGGELGGAASRGGGDGAERVLTIL